MKTAEQEEIDKLIERCMDLDDYYFRCLINEKYRDLNY